MAFSFPWACNSSSEAQLLALLPGNKYWQDCQQIIHVFYNINNIIVLQEINAMQIHSWLLNLDCVGRTLAVPVCQASGSGKDQCSPSPAEINCEGPLPWTPAPDPWGPVYCRSKGQKGTLLSTEHYALKRNEWLNIKGKKRHVMRIWKSF